MGVILERDARDFFQEVCLAKEESTGVDPRKHDTRNDFTDTFLTEAQVLAPNDGGVDEEHPIKVSAN